MLFTELKFSPDHIAQLVEQRRAGLMSNRGLGDLLGFGLNVVNQRLGKDPHRYLDYGPYWWALKDVLRNNGTNLGDHSDPLVAAEYVGVDDVSTLIAADEFRTQFLATQMRGTNRYLLTHDDPEWYVLFDPDMEGRVSGSVE